jgi:hypothetical protein
MASADDGTKRPMDGALELIVAKIPTMTNVQLLEQWLHCERVSPSWIGTELLRAEIFRLMNQGRNLEHLVGRTLSVARLFIS